MSRLPTRRVFLKGTAVALASIPLYRSSIARGAANSRLQVAGIGVSGMGGATIGNVSSHSKVDVVAICDVDANNLKKAAEKYAKARRYADWRELLAEEKHLDALTIGIPDHMHAAVAMSAIDLGKHVYLQKPMTHDVFEARTLTEAAHKAGVVTQLGNQHASGPGDRMAVQLIREGKIGKVKEAYMWSNRHGVGQYRLEGPRPVKADPVPANLNWDLWIGTAPQRPYANTVYHPVKWRTWIDFGTGWGGDIGCHIDSAVFHALDLTAPTSITAKVEEAWVKSPARRADCWPRSQRITYQFPGTPFTASSTFTATWLDGEEWPSDDIHKLFENTKWPEEASIFVGEEGCLLLPHQQGPRLFPTEKYKDLKRPKMMPMDHYHSWVDACIAGNRTGPVSHFDFAGPMSETVLLGTVANRVPDQALQWDATKCQFTNNAEANALLKRTYRKGWEVKGL